MIKASDIHKYDEAIKSMERVEVIETNEEY